MRRALRFRRCSRSGRHGARRCAKSAACRAGAQIGDLGPLYDAAGAKSMDAAVGLRQLAIAVEHARRIADLET